MKNRIKWLQSMRGLACLIVLVAHIVASTPVIGVYASGCGKIGVWLFMLISGYLLLYSYDNKEVEFGFKNILLFYEKKIVKIYPAYMCSLIMALLLHIISISDISCQLLLQSAWGHFWYMPVILKFYIISPIFLLLFRFIKKYVTNVNYSRIMFIIVLTVTSIILSLMFPYAQYNENSIMIRWYLPVFILGIILYLVLCEEHKTHKTLWIYDMLLLIAVVLILVVTPLGRKLIWGIEPGGYLQNKYLYISLCWSLIILGVLRGHLFRLLENCGWLQLVGEYSYEIYLVHFLILNKMCVFFPNNILVRIVLIIIITAVLSVGINYIIKKVLSKLSIHTTCVLIIILFIMISGFGRWKATSASDVSKNRLYVPTMITKVNSDYFIVDCWQHRVLYSENIHSDISNWNILTDNEYIGGHTVCSDGRLLVLDNTDNSQVLVYRKENGKYVKRQTFFNVNGRPHFVTYDSDNELFYVIASVDAKIYVFRNNNDNLELERVDDLPEIQGSYVRSISIIDGCLYTVSGPSCINKYRIYPNSFVFEEAYSVPGQIAGMNQITKIGSYFYITINTDAVGSVDAATIIRTKDLNSIVQEKWEDLYDKFGFVGQPYYITHFDNKYYITEISADKGNGIKSFQIRNGEIECINTKYFWDDVLQDSRDVYMSGENNRTDTKEKVDLIVFSGQSNMSGKGEAEAAPQVIRGYEYKSVTDATMLYPIEEPFGLYENRKDGINDTWENMTILRKSGGMVSALANGYYRATGIPIVGVSASEGSTTISEWMPGTDKYNDLVERVQSSRDFITSNEKYELRHVYLVWCQGESDGDSGTEEAVYYNMLNDFTASLVEGDVVEHCFIIGIGEKQGDEPNNYEQIRIAQQKLCDDSDYCTMTASFYGYKEKGLMKDEYHYTQEGYNIIGEEVGEIMGKYVSDY